MGSKCLCVHARQDPTRTTRLRRDFAQAARRRFEAVGQAIRLSVVEQNAFGLVTNRVEGAGSRAFAFATDAAKIEAFNAWLGVQIEEEILEVEDAEDAFTADYIRRAYIRGVTRGQTEARREAGAATSTLSTEALLDMPIHKERLAVAYTRAFEDLKGITEEMADQISRTLASGLAEGKGPFEIARDMTDRVEKIGKTRATTLARTETVRAHHAANIATYKDAGLAGVKVKAEFSTAGDGDDRVCERCESLEGRIFTLDEIEDLIPVHPSCRCVAIPHVA